MEVLARDDLLQLMDLNMVEAYREHSRHVDGGEVRDLESMTIAYVPRGDAMHNPIVVHGPTTLEALRDAAERYCWKPGRKHCVFTREHADGHLDEGLEAAGYRHLLSTPGMVLMPECWEPRALDLPPGLHIRPVESHADVLAYGALVAEAFAVYGIDPAAVRTFFTRLESLHGPSVQGFLGTLDGRPVTCAALYESHGVAGVGWVGTHPSCFGRRLAEAATAAVVEEGFRRGLRLANLQASPMGEAVYRRMGFETPTRYKVFLPAE